MSGGYIGKMLFVDLSIRSIREEALDESTCSDYIGGYGLGARILYSRQKAGVDPLCKRSRSVTAFNLTLASDCIA